MEHFDQTLQTALIKLVNESQNDWDDHLSGVHFGYRTALQKATKTTPFEVMYCQYDLILHTFVEYNIIYFCFLMYSKAVLPAEMNAVIAESCPDIIAANDSEVESDIWDADYIISHAKAMARVREKINAKTMSNIKIAQVKDKVY